MGIWDEYKYIIVCFVRNLEKTVINPTICRLTTTYFKYAKYKWPSAAIYSFSLVSLTPSCNMC